MTASLTRARVFCEVEASMVGYRLPPLTEDTSTFHAVPWVTAVITLSAHYYYLL